MKKQKPTGQQTHALKPEYQFTDEYFANKKYISMKVNIAGVRVEVAEQNSMDLHGGAAEILNPKGFIVANVHPSGDLLVRTADGRSGFIYRVRLDHLEF